MSTNHIAAPATPRPYKVDEPLVKVQTVERDGDQRYLFRYDFVSINRGNVKLLYDREDEVIRVSEQMTKERVRRRFNSLDADANFFSHAVRSGGWRPYGLDPYRKEQEGLIPSEFRNFYAFDEEAQLWQPGWQELQLEQLLTFTPEKMQNAVEHYLRCKGEYVASGFGIQFMFEQAGKMNIRLLIGDSEEPAYRLLLSLNRPERNRRSDFRENFAVPIERRVGEFIKVETTVDLRQGEKVFDQYFNAVVSDADHSEVVFDDRRTAEQRGGEPEPVSAVPVEGEEEEFRVRPYDDTMKQTFLDQFNPMFKVEVAAAMVQAFNQADRE